MNFLSKFFLPLLIVLNVIAANASSDDEDYFNQFLFQKENLSDDPDFPNYIFHYIVSKYDIKFQRNDGVFVNPLVSLMLFPDKTFWLEYRENYFTNPDDHSFYPGPCLRQTGTWKVTDKQLEIDTYAIGNRHMSNSQNGIVINFLKDMKSPGLTQIPLETSLGSGNSDPREFNFCMP
ncbi:MAG: hypothetical protein WA160_05850 [Pseudobdellovibrio sp.]